MKHVRWYIIPLVLLLAVLATIPLVTAENTINNSGTGPVVNDNGTVTIDGVTLPLVESKVYTINASEFNTPLTKEQFIAANQRYIDFLTGQFGKERAEQMVNDEYERSTKPSASGAPSTSAGNISLSADPIETPHYIYDPKTGALIGYGTTPSPEELKILNRTRGPGYSPFPAPTPLAMDISPEKPVYAYGAPVKVNITLSNAIADLFTFPGFPPALEVSTRPDGWNKGIVRNLPHGEETQILEPHSTASTILAWDQRNDQQVQVDPGVYYLTAQAKFTQNLTPDSTITFGPDPGFMNARSEVIVQYPQGALAGSLYPDTTVTDSEVTARLESLALDERGGFANLTVIAPAPRKGSDSLPGFSQVTTEYRVDDGPARDFRDTISWYGNGVNKVTLHLAPVPCDAREIHITATTFDPYRGHWNFTVDTSAIRTCAVDNDTLFSRETMRNSTAVKTPTTPLPAPLPLTFTITALGIAGVISLMQKRWMR